MSFIADYVGISSGRVHSVLVLVLAENLLMIKVPQRYLSPQMFSDVLKAEQFPASAHLLCQYNNNSK